MQQPSGVPWAAAESNFKTRAPSLDTFKDGEKMTHNINDVGKM